jgi:hypothetical protein
VWLVGAADGLRQLAEGCDRGGHRGRIRAASRRRRSVAGGDAADLVHLAGRPLLADYTGAADPGVEQTARRGEQPVAGRRRLPTARCG